MSSYKNQSYRQENRNGGNGDGNASGDPALVAFAVEQVEGGKAHWTRVGRMFAHSDGKGFVVLLSAMPFDKRIVIREEAPRTARGYAAKDAAAGRGAQSW